MSDISDYELVDLLAMAVAAGASDVHLSVGAPPMMRLHGGLKPIGDHHLTLDSARELVSGILNETQKARLEEKWELDFAIQGKGFFQVQRPNGSVGYTRDGSFKLSPDRTIVTKQGFPVMGDGGPLTLKPGGGRVSINAEGTIIQGDTPVAKLGVFEFPNPKSLQRVGDGLLGPSDPNVQPQAIDNPSVLNGQIEGSNVSPLQEMVNLVSVSRAYEASQRVIFANDENTGKAIETLGNPNS